MSTTESAYWQGRYEKQKTGWDIGYPSTPLKEYIDQLTDKSLRILIPGAGNAYEAEYLWQQGFTNTYVLDIAPAPLAALKKRVPDFPAEQLMEGDFFTHEGEYDLIIEQTFFCSFYPKPETRRAYAKKMNELLSPAGKLAGVWFEIPLVFTEDKRPYGGDRELYLSFLVPPLELVLMEPCYNSIKPRMGKELFGIFRKG